MALAALRRFVRDHALLPRGELVVAACSGGGDSVALVVALDRLAQELGFALAVATVDHGLRPESREEVDGVRRLAESLGRPFHVRSVSLDTGSALQARARDARYAALGSVATELGASRIATGHTADDQAETVLARLTRGAGVRGLGAMRPARRLRDHVLVRPLLATSRDALRELLRRGGHPWVEDPSNADDRFERVRIRRWLAELGDPAIVAHLNDLAADAAAHTELVEAELERRGLFSASVGRLATAPAVLRVAALRHRLEPHLEHPLGRAHLEQLDALVLTERGVVWLPGQMQARVEDGELVLEPVPTPRRGEGSEGTEPA